MKDKYGDDAQSGHTQRNGSRAAKLALIVSGVLVLASCTSVAEPVATSQVPTSEAPVAVTEEAEASISTETESEAIETEGTFKVSVMDYDENPGDYPEFEVWIRDYGSWFPSFEFGGDLLESVGPFPVGELIGGDMYIYPFGRNGLEVSVPILISEEHISDSTRDMLSIYIEDGILTVFGTVVDGLEIIQSLD